MPSKTFFPADGRQSETAVRVARGTRRFLRRLGFSSVQELALPSGLRADIVALGGDGKILIVEIKSSVADFRADQKWTGYRDHCDRFFFAVPEDFPQNLLPSTAGLIVADAYGAEMISPAEEHRLPAATRKAMLLRYGHMAAERLHELWDPERDH
jgi:hypothetical protein